MVKFLDLFKNFMFIGLIVLAIFSFTIFVQDDNEASGDITNNSLINSTFTNLTANLRSFRDQSQLQKDLFEKENPVVGFGSLLLFSVVSSGKVFNSMVVGVFNIIIKLPVVFLGIDPSVVAVLGTLLIITIIIGLWSLYKLGG